MIIEYEIDTGQAKTKDSIALEKINDSWFLTQALANDPILMHWNNPKSRIQVAPSSFKGFGVSQ